MQAKVGHLVRARIEWNVVVYSPVPCTAPWSQTSLRRAPKWRKDCSAIMSLHYETNWRRRKQCISVGPKTASQPPVQTCPHQLCGQGLGTDSFDNIFKTNTVSHG